MEDTITRYKGTQRLQLLLETLHTLRVATRRAVVKNRLPAGGQVNNYVPFCYVWPSDQNSPLYMTLGSHILVRHFGNSHVCIHKVIRKVATPFTALQNAAPSISGDNELLPRIPLVALVGFPGCSSWEISIIPILQLARAAQVTWANSVVVTPDISDICITDTYETRKACQILTVKKEGVINRLQWKFLHQNRLGLLQSQSSFRSHVTWLRTVCYILFCYQLQRPESTFSSQKFHG